jgi:uncharacterized membrane protein YgcG
MFVQMFVMSMALTASQRESDEVSQHFVDCLCNVLPPLIVFSEGSGLDERLSPEAAAARRALCIECLITYFSKFHHISGTAALCFLISLIGTALGKTMRETGEFLFRDPLDLKEAPAVFSILHGYTNTAGGEKCRPMDWVPSDPFLGPIYRSRCCTNPNCGLLPGDPYLQFQVCSLCKDPAVGHFCCKEPCFAAFWRAGHKDTCAGRDKHKKKGKGGGGGGGDGGGGGGGAGGSSGATGS